MALKILWHSNAPHSSTGYGVQTKLFIHRLNEHHDVAVSAFYGLEGGRITVDGIPIYPNRGVNFGNEVIHSHARSWFDGDLRGGLVLTLMDTWVLDHRIWSQMNVASWVPIDHDPVPPKVASFFRGSQSIPIAMSRFGQERLMEFDPLYVPHGVDTSIYKPRDRKEARELVGLPEEAFIVGVVATNMGSSPGGIPSRKSFPQIIEAFARFRAKHSDACLYLHTDIAGGNGGLDLPKILEAYGLGDGSVLFADQYRYHYDPFPSGYMSALYSGFDVLLNPSKGEGFGVPVLEAQACGTPAIVSDFSAMPEVCGAGWHVECGQEWSGQLAWQVTPSVEDIVRALTECYGLPAGTQKNLSEKAVAHAAGYDADHVLSEFWLPALEEIEQRIEAREPMVVAA